MSLGVICESLMMTEMTFKMANNQSESICVDGKFPLPPVVQCDGGGSFNKDVKIYTKLCCHLWLIIGDILTEMVAVKVGGWLQRMTEQPSHRTLWLWIVHEVREWRIVEDNDHLIFLLMLPTVCRDHLSMLIMLLLLMDKENFLDMKVYEEDI